MIDIMKHSSHVSGSEPMHSFTKSTKEVVPVKYMIGLFLVSIIVGTAAGFSFSRLVPKTESESVVKKETNTDIVVNKDDSGSVKSAGIVDEKEFPDKAEGSLKPGSIEGEGTHYLERKGGKSQNVYLTSSAVDLSLFEGKKVKIMGKTYSTQKAGWFMDVGYIELQ